MPCPYRFLPPALPGEQRRIWLSAILFLGVLSCLIAAKAATPGLAVTLPTGETSLTSIGFYQVGWQSYGKEPVLMPLSWTGHFDEQTGISYQPWGQVSEREALLLHSPWRVPPGRTWVDYDLTLPPAVPIRLDFGIAMGPDVAVPGKSDGATFSCSVLADGEKRELMRKHQDQAAWLDFSFDLSAFAGKTIVLTLQIEPGPKNDASFDYSFFGNPRITAGHLKPDRAALLKQITSTPAYRTLDATSLSRKHATYARSGLLALSNCTSNGVLPSNLLPCRNSIEAVGATWQFSYVAADCRVVYIYEPRNGTLDDFTVVVDKGAPFKPALNGGAWVAQAERGKPPIRRRLEGGKPVIISRDGSTLRVVWEYPSAPHPVRIEWEFKPAGKALAVSARCDQTVIESFSLGMVAAPLRKTLGIPYLLGRVDYLPSQNLYCCRYLDWTASRSSSAPQGNATYDTKTDGTRNSLYETGYVTVSPDIGEVLPNIPNPPSPYLGTLGPNIMLDIWGHAEGTYRGDAALLRRLKGNGVDHLVIIQHDWQHFGYDVKLPDHLPANPAYGSEADLAAFGDTAQAAGYLWSLHENYIDLYPDAPSYDPACRVLNADGSPCNAWYNPGTKVQSFGLKCNRALDFARLNSPEAHRRYGTTAAYLDVHSCVPPWHQLDHDASQPLAATAAAKVANDRALFQFERDTHRGPLFGEGANHFFWAGCCDGVEAQVAGGENHTALLDFDLLKIHSQMVNHGMGYYERWFLRGYDARWGLDAGSLEQLDKYRAMELAYGHAGFIGNNLTRHVPSIVREHHLMHPVQRLYGTARPVEIRYEIDGCFVTAGAALAVGDTSRQRVRYDSGLTLWINWRPEIWKLDAQAGLPASFKHRAVVLPQWGFFALGPRTEVSTALHDRSIADYAECPEFVFADARTMIDQPWVHNRKEIEPRLRSLEYLGGDRIRVTYEWRVNDTLPTDYRCFVHFLNPQSTDLDPIVFQQDHPLPKPTSQWKPGDVILDGPYEIRVPATWAAYDLGIGLFKNERLVLRGLDDGTSRIRLARLALDRDGSRITAITAGPPQPPPHQPAPVSAADFAARRNPEGTWIDFGKLATDGSVKINRSENRLLIFPYPRDRQFRLSLDLRSLPETRKAAPSSLKVRALAADSAQDLGPVPFTLDAGKLDLELGRPGAAQFDVTW